MNNVVKKFENLAKIELSKEDQIIAEEAIIHAIEMKEKMANVNTDGVEPLFSTVDDEFLIKKNEDIQFCENIPEDKEKINTSGKLEIIFANAPEKDGNFFISPSILSK